MIRRLEWLKLRRSRRIWLSAACLLLFLVLMLLGFYTYAKTETGGNAEFRYTFENRSYFNGLTFAIYAFYFGFLLLLPIFAATEGGSQIAGDTGQGTMRTLLARPLSRWQIFRDKALVSFVYLVFVTGAFLAAGLLLGLMAVGWGNLDLYPGVLQMTDRHQTLPQREALLRFLYVWPAASLALAVPLSLSLLLSTWTRNAVNAVGSSVAIYLVFYVISEIHFFHELRPYLFTSGMSYWRGLFQENVDWGEMGRELSRLLAFAFFFGGLAYRRFRAREER